jgi:hypothetical protein
MIDDIIIWNVLGIIEMLIHWSTLQNFLLFDTAHQHSLKAEIIKMK